MKCWSFYDPSTGVFDGRQYEGDEAGLLLQLQHLGTNVAAVEGAVDHQRRRVDFAKSKLVDYMPLRPANTADETYSWDSVSARWVAEKTLAAWQREARAAIDAAAGVARMRYITETPGQQAVYLRKAEQAKAFRTALYLGAAPPFVAADANAMGITQRQAAERILAKADNWGDVVAPAIESARIGGKRAVGAATSPAAVAAARASALAALAAI